MGLEHTKGFLLTAQSVAFLEEEIQRSESSRSNPRTRGQGESLQLPCHRVDEASSGLVVYEDAPNKMDFYEYALRCSYMFWQPAKLVASACNFRRDFRYDTSMQAQQSSSRLNHSESLLSLLIREIRNKEKFGFWNGGEETN